MRYLGIDLGSTFVTVERLTSQPTTRPVTSVGDFYPLTPYSLTDEVWLACRLRKDDLREGLLLAFRRFKCGTASTNLRLLGLAADQSYELNCEDTAVTKSFTGKQLAAGLDVSIERQPGADLITYQQLPERRPTRERSFSNKQSYPP